MEWFINPYFYPNSKPNGKMRMPTSLQPQLASLSSARMALPLACGPSLCLGPSDLSKSKQKVWDFD